MDTLQKLTEKTGISFYVQNRNELLKIIGENKTQIFGEEIACPICGLKDMHQDLKDMRPSYEVNLEKCQNLDYNGIVKLLNRFI